MPSGTEGYAAEAERLFERYEAREVEDVHASVLHLFPAAPARVIDIGSGTGRDAAWFAANGYSVVAVEPTDVLRSGAMALHPSPAIEWVDDHLPDLGTLQPRDPFDLVMLCAVWMHLDEAQRRQGMAGVAPLVAAGGRMVMVLRHGPVPPGRRMFEVTAGETIALAEAHGLRLLLEERGASRGERNKGAGVSWTRLVFERPGDDGRVEEP